MFALVYASHATHPFHEKDLDELADHAAGKNRQLNVTGYLNYKNGVFFQYLEGDRQNVVELMDVIALDTRHRVANTIYLGDLEDRLFPDWRMRYVRAGEMSFVRLEDVLEGAILTMTARAFREDEARATVLNMTKKLAEVRTQLAHSA